MIRHPLFLVFQVICLLLIVPGVRSDTNEVETGFLKEFSEYFASHHTAVSWDTRIGYADNVTLVASNETSDLFAVVQARAEYRRQFAGGASLYVDTSLERTQYIRENDASEWFVDAFGEYRRDLESWAWGLSDTLSYEDYRSFDEEGGVLPSGKYEAVVNRTRVSGSWFYATDLELEAGLSWRLKNYLEVDRDFDETGLDLTHRWKMSSLWRSSVTGSYRKQKYSDWQALSSDGTLADTNPTETFGVIALRGSLTRALPHEGRAYLTLRYADYDENFEDEASYEETGIDVGGILAVSRDYVVEAGLGISARDYSTRTVTGGGNRQDDVVTMSLSVERRLVATTSAYLLLNIGQRSSNDPAEDYQDNSVAIGLRGIL